VPPAQDDQRAEQDRFELVLLSYTEVLDATKHQDDKIGRILAALAFFVGGVLAFLNPQAISVRYRMGGQQVPLVAMGVGAFLVLAALSALMFVLATTSPLTLPRSHTTGPRTSHLYFRLIADEHPQRWKELWVPTSTLRPVLTEELINESYNIAKRASSKYERSQEAIALLLVAMPFFAVSVILALDSLNVTAAVAANVTIVDVEWTQIRRLMVGGVLSFFAGLYIYFAGVTTNRRGWSIALLVVAFPAFVLLTVALPATWWSAVVLALVGLVAAKALSDLAVEEAPGDKKPSWWDRRGRSPRWWITVLVCLVVTAAASWMIATDAPLARLGIGVMVVSMLPLSNFKPGAAKVLSQISTQSG